MTHPVLSQVKLAMLLDLFAARKSACDAHEEHLAEEPQSDCLI